MPRCWVGAVDVGTSRVKLVLFDEGLRVLRTHSSRSPLVLRGDIAVQDAEALSSLFLEAVRRAGLEGCRVVGVTVYRGSVVAWGRDGRPLTDVVTWLDRRSIRVYRSLGLAARLASRLPGVGAALRPGSPALVFHMLMRDKALGAAVRSGRAFVWSLDSYLAFLVTGRFLGDVSQAALTGLINPYTLRPLGLVARLLGLGDMPVPELRGHEEPLGAYSGVEVGPFIADQQASIVGLGCLKPGCLKITMGTGVFVDAVVEGRPPLVLREGIIPVIAVALGETPVYGVEGFASGVGLVYEAFAEAVGGFERLEELARRSDGSPVLVVPALAGLRTPYQPELRGALLGVSPGFRGSSIARGLIDGTGLLVRAIYSRVVGYAGTPSRIRVGGGLSRLRVLVEAVADFLGSRVERGPDSYDSARGAALLAAHASGLISRRDLYNPPVDFEPVEPRRSMGAEEAERAWRSIVAVLGSKSFSKRLSSILEYLLRSQETQS